MELEVLKKKISTFRGDGGRVHIMDESLLMEILQAWEQWTGPAKGFYPAIGVSQTGMASIIGKAKKLKQEGHFPTEEFNEIKLTDSSTLGGVGVTPCSGIEVAWANGRLIRFPEAGGIGLVSKRDHHDSCLENHRSQNKRSEWVY